MTADTDANGSGDSENAPSPTFYKMSNYRTRLCDVIIDTITEEDFRELLLVYIQKAKDGDVKAMQVLLDYLML